MLETVKRLMEIAEWFCFGLLVASCGVYYYNINNDKSFIAFAAFELIAIFIECLLIRQTFYKKNRSILSYPPIPIFDVFAISIVCLYYNAFEDISIILTMGFITATFDLFRWGVMQFIKDKN